MPEIVVIDVPDIRCSFCGMKLPKGYQSIQEFSDQGKKQFYCKLEHLEKNSKRDLILIET